MELRHGRRRQSLTTGVLTHIPVDLMEEEMPVQRAKGQEVLATPQPYLVMEELSSL